MRSLRAHFALVAHVIIRPRRYPTGLSVGLRLSGPGSVRIGAPPGVFQDAVYRSWPEGDRIPNDFSGEPRRVRMACLRVVPGADSPVRVGRGHRWCQPKGAGHWPRG